MTTIAAATRRAIRPGHRVSVFYGPGNINNETRHIRAIIDDDWIVYRVWSPARKSWRYSVSWLYEYQLGMESGAMRIEK